MKVIHLTPRGPPSEGMEVGRCAWLALQGIRCIDAARPSARHAFMVYAFGARDNPWIVFGSINSRFCLGPGVCGGWIGPTAAELHHKHKWCSKQAFVTLRTLTSPSASSRRRGFRSLLRTSPLFLARGVQAWGVCARPSASRIRTTRRRRAVEKASLLSTDRDLTRCQRPFPAMVEAKLVVLGAQGCGKTSLVVRHTRRGSLPKGSLPRSMGSTVGASFVTSLVQVGDQRVTLQVWDTAGQERFRAMAPMYYRHANAALIVYDITSRPSFEAAASWVDEMKDKVGKKLVLCVIGNKTDLQNDRQVSIQEGIEYAKSIDAIFWETSALTSDGVYELFQAVASAILEQHAEEEERKAQVKFEKLAGGEERITLGDPTEERTGPATENNFCCWS